MSLRSVKAALRVGTGGQGEEKSKRENSVCACEMRVKAMENMIAGRDVRSL